MSLSCTAESFWQFDEAVIQGEVMPYAVLPSLVSAAEEAESSLKEIVDLIQGELLRWGTLYGHND